MAAPSSELADFAQRHGLSSEARQELQCLLESTILLTNKRVTVCVPATVANLGPGLETCGLAVDIWDEYTLEYADHFTLEVVGDGALVPRTDENLVVVGASSAFKAANLPFPALRVSCTHRIPVGKGLGAAAASFVGGYLAGSVLCTEELRLSSDSTPLRAVDFKEVAAATGDSTYLETLLRATVLRGWNPGNVCPAVYGALQIGINMDSGLRSHRVPTPNGLVCVIFVPDESEEGTGLPDQPVDRKAAIFNVGRVALLINCFCTGEFAVFQKATEDALAQPLCKAQFPFLAPVIQAAVGAGAAGACPCAYGPSVMALITGRSGDVLAQSASNQLERGVATAMLSKAEELGISGQVLIAKPADVGAHVIAQKSELAAADSSRITYFQ